MDSEQTHDDSLAELRSLVVETQEVAKANHKILKRMERNALLAFFGKLILWLLILGVPLIFIGPYVKALFGLFTGTPPTSTPSGIFGLPSAQQVQDLVNTYKLK